jgi:hypothetical protein
MKAGNVRAVSIMLTSLAQRRSRDAVRDSGGLPTFLVAFHKPLGSFNTLFAGNTSHQFILSTRNSMDGGLLGTWNRLPMSGLFKASAILVDQTTSATSNARRSVPFQTYAGSVY